MAASRVVVLNSGAAMPMIGLGTHKIRGLETVTRVLKSAFDAGYRSIDSAAVYRNENDIGHALKELRPSLGLQREEIFVTTKLGPKDQGEKACREACLKSIENLGLDWVDLYLIHWPGTQGFKPENHQHPEKRLASWRAIEQLYKEGKVKSIGVSNYTLRHMKELLEQCTVKPAVLQIECHPLLQQKELRMFCQQEGIHFQAYSSLGTTTDQNQLLTNSVVCEVAANCGKSSAQVLLQWALHHGIGVIPKSTSRSHLKDNMAALDFTLSQSDIKRLDDLDSNKHLCWNPTQVT